MKGYEKMVGYIWVMRFGVCPEMVDCPDCTNCPEKWLGFIGVRMGCE